MTAEENTLIAEAQAAMQRLRKQVPGERGITLLRLASEAERELMISGTCGECFDAMFSEEEDDRPNA